MSSDERIKTSSCLHFQTEENGWLLPFCGPCPEARTKVKVISYLSSFYLYYLPFSFLHFSAFSTPLTFLDGFQNLRFLSLHYKAPGVMQQLHRQAVLALQPLCIFNSPEAYTSTLLAPYPRMTYLHGSCIVVQF